MPEDTQNSEKLFRKALAITQRSIRTTVAIPSPHTIRPGYRLIDIRPAETTASAYRFEVKLAPQGTEKLPVNEEQVVDQTIALANSTPDFLLTYIQNKDLDEAARKQLERIAGEKRLIVENAGAIQRNGEQINDLVQDQQRIRQNITSLNQVSGQQEQVQNYARTLASQETRLASLRDLAAGLKQKKTELEAGLNKLIEAMEF